MWRHCPAFSQSLDAWVSSSPQVAAPLTPKWVRRLSQRALHRFFHQRSVVNLCPIFGLLIFVPDTYTLSLFLIAGAICSSICIFCWRSLCMESSPMKCLASAERWTQAFSVYVCLTSCWLSRLSFFTSASLEIQVGPTKLFFFLYFFFLIFVFVAR